MCLLNFSTKTAKISHELLMHFMASALIWSSDMLCFLYKLLYVVIYPFYNNNYKFTTFWSMLNIYSIWVCLWIYIIIYLFIKINKTWVNLNFNQFKKCNIKYKILKIYFFCILNKSSCLYYFRIFHVFKINLLNIN